MLPNSVLREGVHRVRSRDGTRKGVGPGTLPPSSRGELRCGSVRGPWEKVFRRDAVQGRAEEVQEVPICGAH